MQVVGRGVEMTDNDPQDSEVLALVESAGEAGLDPNALLHALVEKGYSVASVIEALQRALERDKISLNSQGMVFILDSHYADAA